MVFEFSVPQQVVVTTLDHLRGIVVDRYRDETTQTSFYRVAFERFGVWSIETFPEMSLAAEKRGLFSRWFRRRKQEKASEVTRPIPFPLGADMKLPPGVNLPPSFKDDHK